MWIAGSVLYPIVPPLEYAVSYPLSWLQNVGGVNIVVNGMIVPVMAIVRVVAEICVIVCDDMMFNPVYILAFREGKSRRTRRNQPCRAY